MLLLHTDCGVFTKIVSVKYYYIWATEFVCLPTRVTCFDPYIGHSQAHNSKNMH